jgi:hypothetical protein
LSARGPTKKLKRIQYFRQLGKPTKQIISFSLAVLADENIVYIFVGCLGRRKEMYFRRLPMKMRSFSSILFLWSIFVGRPTNIYIFDGFLAILDGFWPMKLSYFLVVYVVKPKF